jgi:molecular chaperone HscB
VPALEALQAEVDVSRAQLLQQCASLLDELHDAVAAVGPVRALMFIEKFTQDLNQRFDQFE